MEEVSLLCDEFEQLQDPGLSMATEVVEVYGAMLFEEERHLFASQRHSSCFEQSLCR